MIALVFCDRSALRASDGEVIGRTSTREGLIRLLRRQTRWNQGEYVIRGTRAALDLIGAHRAPCDGPLVLGIGAWYLRCYVDDSKRQSAPGAA